jgi:DEAD/DEAH box helicase domain-containing protein
VLPRDFEPHRHQELGFERVGEPEALSTLIATGTGSRKTECFLYPILDFCFRRRGQEGIKAIVIYPMNALATDQARRFAQAVFQNPELRGYVTVGLYIGGEQRGATRAMTETEVITDRETLRQAPPDVLLTN